MDQLLSVWNAQTPQRRVTFIGASALILLALLGLMRLASNPTMALLYSGLEESAAGEIVNAIEQQGIEYEIKGGSIYVPETQRDSLRLTLASEGMPNNSNKGYELLDNLSGFGTTSQMFDAAYWRAKEGELARTIVSNPQITNARVHIANSANNPFQRDVKSTASISVTTTGGTLSVQQAKALKYLVSSAVPGLAVEDVSVIDDKGGLVGSEDEATGLTSSEDRASALRDRVQRLMEARVGVGNSVVEVSVETVTESELIRERRFDPEERVAISTDTEERSNNSEDSGNPNVTVASNLPDGEAEGGGNSTSQNSESRERVNYEVSETTREITRVPGAIKRLTVAVLVNGTYEVGDDGIRAFQPLPDVELADLRELVSSAVGFEEARGDVITIRSLPFERPEGLGTEPIEQGLFVGEIDTMNVIQMALLTLVAVILGLFVVRPIFTRQPVTLPGADELAALPGAEDADGDGALNGELAMDDGGFMDLPMMGGGGGMNELPTFDFEVDEGGMGDDPVDRLRGLIEEKKPETMEILRSWLDEPEGAS